MGTEILGLGGPTHQLKGLGCKFCLSSFGTSSPLASTGATDPRTALHGLGYRKGILDRPCHQGKLGLLGS